MFDVQVVTAALLQRRVGDRCSRRLGGLWRKPFRNGRGAVVDKMWIFSNVGRCPDPIHVPNRKYSRERPGPLIVCYTHFVHAEDTAHRIVAHRQSGRPNRFLQFRRQGEDAQHAAYARRSERGRGAHSCLHPGCHPVRDGCGSCVQAPGRDLCRDLGA